MNASQIEKAVRYLSHDTIGNVREVGDRTYRGRLLGIELLHLSRQHDADGVSAKIDFKNEYIELSTWYESHHNGDTYGEQVEIIQWDKLALIEKRIKNALSLKIEQEIENEQKRKLKEEILNKVNSVVG